MAVGGRVNVIVWGVRERGREREAERERKRKRLRERRAGRRDEEYRVFCCFAHGANRSIFMTLKVKSSFKAFSVTTPFALIKKYDIDILRNAECWPSSLSIKNIVMS